jgi:hypothetical protein
MERHSCIATPRHSMEFRPSSFLHSHLHHRSSVIFPFAPASRTAWLDDSFPFHETSPFQDTDSISSSLREISLTRGAFPMHTTPRLARAHSYGLIKCSVIAVLFAKAAGLGGVIPRHRLVSLHESHPIASDGASCDPTFVDTTFIGTASTFADSVMTEHVPRVPWVDEEGRFCSAPSQPLI